MVWSTAVIRAFRTVTPTKESTYYGPYNVLLNELFPASEGFMVCPQHQVLGKVDSVDLTTVYVVEDSGHPVFFTEVKVPGALLNDSARAAADDQMRQRYRELYNKLGYQLHAMSALGTKICFYKLEPPDGVITPDVIERDPRRVNDVAPAPRWDLDLLDPSGEAELRKVVGEVKTIAGSLAQP